MMLNETTLKVAKKYEHMIEIVFKDEDGYWVETKPGFKFDCNETHIASESTQKEIKEKLKDIVPCTCTECHNAMIVEGNEKHIEVKECGEQHPYEVKAVDLDTWVVNGVMFKLVGEDWGGHYTKQHKVWIDNKTGRFEDYSSALYRITTMIEIYKNEGRKKLAQYMMRNNII